MATDSTLSNARNETDTFGCAVRRLDEDRHLTGSGINLYRKASAAGSPGQVLMPANNKGYLIGITLEGGHSRRIFNEHHSTAYDFESDSVYVRTMSEDYKADLQGAFNFVLLEVSTEALKEIADESHTTRTTELKSVFATPDATLAGLSRALFSASLEGRTPSTLFVDQLSLAMGAHIVQAYGNGNATGSSVRRTLSRRNENRAKDIIGSRLDGDISVAELASECNLSRGVFIRAFRETTGKTPHQWLTRQRIEKAQTLLLTSAMSLAEISTNCGFADQSHFTRVFSATVGAPPSAWRRARLL